MSVIDVVPRAVREDDVHQSGFVVDNELATTPVESTGVSKWVLFFVVPLHPPERRFRVRVDEKRRGRYRIEILSGRGRDPVLRLDATDLGDSHYLQPTEGSALQVLTGLHAFDLAAAFAVL